MFKADQMYREMKAVEAKIKAIDITDRNIDIDTMVEYIRQYTDLIYNYKWIGSIYDIYANDCIVQRDNGLVLNGARAMRANTMQLLAAFPDLEFVFADIFGVKTDNGFKVWRRFFLDGNNLGYSQYGPPTGKNLENKKAMGMSMMTIQYIDGKWRVLYEDLNLSTEWMRKVCTL